MSESKKEKHLNSKKLLAKNKHEENKIKMPIKNQCYKDDPPAFVTIVGSKNGGKTSVIKAIVKKFTKQQISQTNGPITLTTTRDKRITLFECKNDIHQYVDTSKVSDMVFFVINGSVGLEYEILEYLSLLLAHGLPKVAFIVTHMDKEPDKSLLKKIKKKIYDEICVGLKFFYLAMHNEKYNDNEILNIIRCISSMKYRPIEWKCSHPHIIVDKIDMHGVYGYVRGDIITKNLDIHIPGHGDNKIAELEVLEDPVLVTSKMRLSDKKKHLYAPMVYKEQVQQEIVTCEDTSQNYKLESTSNTRLFKQSKQYTSNVVGLSISEDINLLQLSDDDVIAPEVEEKETTMSEESETIDIKAKNRFRKNECTEESFIKKFENNVNAKQNIFVNEKNYIEGCKTVNEENKIRGLVYPGEYVKIVLENKLVEDYTLDKILILGKDNINEKKQEVLQGKVKTNKWYNRQLKTNNPLIFSVGWRRYQSIPVYSSKTSGKNRMLKYSFKNGFCGINFYGYVVPPRTNFAVYSDDSSFRVLGYGNIMDITGQCDLVKKLKLVGYPKKILGNTVFVKDLFTSELEVKKFKNAKIKTVSGLKGLIKNPVGKQGLFRGAFEGEMLMSDIIVLKCFVPYPVFRFLLPVTNDNWQGLRSLKKIREFYGVQIEDKHIEEVTDNENEILVKEQNNQSKNFVLPTELEKKLPLDKRCIKVVNNKIELPISPEDKKRQEFILEIERARITKDKNEYAEKQVKEMRKNKEKEKIENEKNEKLKKTIIKSSLQKKRKGKK